MVVEKLRKSAVEEGVVAREYKVKYIQKEFEGDFITFEEDINSVEFGKINNFRLESSKHHPESFFKLLICRNGLLGKFEVHDKFVICQNSEYNSMVCKDSCVEFFFQPNRQQGYFNFEFNCMGTVHCSYIIDPERTNCGFKDYKMIPYNLGKNIIVESSVKSRIENEISIPLKWQLSFFIPFDIIEKYVGKLTDKKNWFGNFYKCADNSSHPHWGSWNPVRELNFHAPQDFGKLIIY